MKAKQHTRIKAFLLMMVFSLNTIIGFACSIGVKMGYNNHHHEKPVLAASSSHHDHNIEQNKEHQHSQNSSGGKDDCCSHGVTSFNLLDKATANSVSILHPVFATAFVLSFYTPWALRKMFIPKNIRAFAQTYHPPIPDIRVAIQSFQI
ncbi:MAG: hypothetical protein J0H46_14545 [Bacteroidetes bacterium]|uniref:hypothetical protein n=1 Tax=uncultured Dysgonomonas sp. TaxID=206096 RepID=UPI001AD1C2B2|nr:hypothetical protein [uncultured Dysgonomonas sp.]MBN9484570.1 hypothetical protein [Bacteroidota bacterium]